MEKGSYKNNLVGKRFGKLTVLKFNPPGHYCKEKWHWFKNNNGNELYNIRFNKQKQIIKEPVEAIS